MKRKKKQTFSPNEAERTEEQLVEDRLEEEQNSEIKVEVKGKATDKKDKETFTLEERCLVLEKENREATDKYLRLLAEFENYRRRNDKDRINWIKNANEKLILKICDVLDDFERALEIQCEDNQLKQFHEGVKLIYTKLEKILAAEGLEKIEALDKEFDPMYHDAISCIPSEVKADTIVSVIQNGYILGNKVIRAAKVAVSAGKQ